MRKLLGTIISVLLTFQMVGCSEEKLIYEELKNRAFVSEQALFIENSTYPEIILFTETTHCQSCVRKNDMSFAVFSPEKYIGYSKLYKLKGNKYFETNTIFLEEDKNLFLPPKKQLNSIEVVDRTLFVSPNEYTTLQYFEVDSIKQQKWNKDNVYDQKFLITGNFLKNKTDDSLTIIFSQSTNSDDEFTLSNSEG
ncbi:MAG: hypothetical protein AB8B69_22315, partial [Chitinophagales bacterium]